MSVSVNANLKARLKALQCHFTWGIYKFQIKNLEGVSEELLDHMTFCHLKFCRAKYHILYYNVLAYLSHLKGDDDIALRFLDKAIEAVGGVKDDPKLLVTYGNFAWVHYHIGKMGEVNYYLAMLAALNNASPDQASETVRNLSGEKGWTFLRLGADFSQRAFESFEKALRRSPKCAAFRTGYAVALYRLEVRQSGGRAGGVATKKASKVADELRKALALEPENAEVMVLLALELRSGNADGQRKEAMRLVKRVLSLAPDAPQVTRYVDEFFRKAASVEESLEALRAALELNPASPFLHYRIGMCHRQLFLHMVEERRRRGWRRRAEGVAPADELSAAAALCVRHFSRAAELKPSDVFARVKLAESYGHALRPDEASEIFRRLETDRSLTEGDRQHVLGSHGVFLLYGRRALPEAVARLKAAYRIPVRGADRERAGKKLRMVADWWRETEPQAANEILAFLSDQDKLDKFGRRWTRKKMETKGRKKMEREKRREKERQAIDGQERMWMETRERAREEREKGRKEERRENERREKERDAAERRERQWKKVELRARMRRGVEEEEEEEEEEEKKEKQGIQSQQGGNWSQERARQKAQRKMRQRQEAERQKRERTERRRKRRKRRKVAEEWRSRRRQEWAGQKEDKQRKANKWKLRIMADDLMDAFGKGMDFGDESLLCPSDDD